MAMEHILFDYKSFKCIKIGFYGPEYFFVNVSCAIEKNVYSAIVWKSILL